MKLTKIEEDTILATFQLIDESKMEEKSHIAIQSDIELDDGRSARLIIATGSDDFTHDEIISLLEAEIQRLKAA